MTLHKKLIILKYVFYAISYICLFTPMLVLCIVNKDTYFVKNKSGWSVAFGGALSVLFAILLAKVGFKKINKALTASMFLVIIWCFESIINDLLAVAFCYWLGIVLFTVFELPAKHYANNLKIYNAEYIKDTAREEIAYKKEAKKQKKQSIEEEQLESGRV